MYIKKVIIENFMPYRGRYVIEFRKGRIVSIVAQYGDDFGRSNRAGKSGFIDAIAWCLYGKSRAKREVEIVHDGAELAEVTTEIRDDERDRSFSVRRVRSSDNRGRLEVTGFEGAVKMVGQEQVDKMLGLTYDDFMATAFFKQNDIDQFMNADHQEKKQILMKWLQVGAWSHYEEAAREHLRALNDRQLTLQGRLSQLPEETHDELREQLRAVSSEKKQLDAEYDKLSRRKAKLQAKKAELDQLWALSEETDEIGEEVEKLRKRRPDGGDTSVRRAELKAAIEASNIDADGIKRAKEVKERAVTALGEVSVRERDLAERLKKVSRGLTGTCPVLDAPCKLIEPDPTHEAKIRKEMEAQADRRARAEAGRDKANNYLRQADRLADARRELERLESDHKLAASIEEQIAALLKRRQKILDKLPKDLEGDLEQVARDYNAVVKDMQIMREAGDKLGQGIGYLNERIRNVMSAAERRQAVAAELADVELRVADAQYALFMFGKNGIPSLELENSFKEVEDDANLILKRLKAPFTLEFESTRELGDWETNCLACHAVFERGERTHVCKSCQTPRQKKRRDELQLKVFEGDAERPFYMDSGGGRVMLSVAIRLALVQLAKRRQGSTWGTLFLDEVFGQLDSVNRAAMSELITQTIVRDLGFEQVFVISHDPTVQSALSDQLVVRRNAKEKFSELRFA